MKRLNQYLTTSNAALTVGIAFIVSFFIVILIDDFLLANFVIPGDTETLANDIELNKKLFIVAAVCYLIVLLLDSIIAFALYVVLRPANKVLASLTSLLRLLYAIIVAIGLLALVFRMIDVYSYASLKLTGYLFFAAHIFLLGYSVFKSKYLPKTLGLLLIFASFTYVVFFVDLQIAQSIEVIIISVMALAELSLSIWLILKRNTIRKI